MPITITLAVEKDIDLAEDKLRDAIRAIALDTSDTTIDAAEGLTRVYRTLKTEAGMCLYMGCRKAEVAAGRCKTHRVSHAKPEA